MLALSKRNSNRKSPFVVVLENVGWPLIWGLGATVVFYALIQQGFIRSDLVRRYFAGHPVEYVEAMMFFIGLSALIRKISGVLLQFATLDRIELSASPLGGQEVGDCSHLLESLTALPASIQKSYLVRRLSEALEIVCRKGAADDLDEELKYLSDLDAVRLHEGYALVRIIIWATPMLGFLGTVIGITLALGNLSPEALVNAPQVAMEGLLAGLSVAFDTTALALFLSIVLMFAQFLTNQLETQLLSAVDARASRELVGRFQRLGTRTDPHAASARRVAESVLQATEQLVQQQAQLWRETIDEAHGRWSQIVGASGQHLQEGLVEALHRVVQTQQAGVASSEAAAQQRVEQHWQQVQAVTSEYSELVRSQQNQLAKQSEMMLKVVKSTGDVVKLEQSLNKNLAALSGARNFEDTVMSLSAAIHLLNTRLGAPSTERLAVGSQDSRSQDQAA